MNKNLDIECKAYYTLRVKYALLFAQIMWGRVGGVVQNRIQELRKAMGGGYSE